MEAIINYLDKYSSQIFILQMGLLFILSAVILYVYFYNRKKYHNLKHQIPASVVKNYLDSIIQNSNALKSSLFRGGGLDVDPESIPSVMPVGDLTGSSQISVNLEGEGGDEALKAEVARLAAQLSAKDNAIKDLEAKNIDLSGVVKQKQERIEELEALLAAAQSEGGADEAIAGKLTEVTAERDKLKEDLAQYEVIEDDLADLKRLRQENEQLKAALAGGDPIVESFSEGAVEAPAVEEAVPEEPVAEEEAPVVEEPVAEEAPAVAEEPVAEEAPAEEVVAVAEEDAAPAEEAASDEAEKSPEDLLSEFEKMLG